MVRVFFYCGSGPKIMQGIYLVEEDPHAGWGRCGLACSEMFKELVVFCIGSSS